VFSQYFSGAPTLSPAAMNAAKCSTPSKPAAAVTTSAARSCTRPRTKLAPAGTASAVLVLRSSRMTTSWPCSSSNAATVPPM
jgi:hypothetical protein